MEVARRRGRRRKKLLNDLKDRRGYSHLKGEALDRTMWRHRFGGGFGSVVRQNTEWMVADDADMSVNTVTTPKHCVVKDALCRYRCRCKYTVDENRRYSITVFRILLSENHIHKSPNSLRAILCILHDFHAGDCIMLRCCTPYTTFACSTYRFQHEAGHCYLVATAHTAWFRIAFVHWHFTWSAGPDSHVQYTVLYFKRIITKHILTSARPLHGFTLLTLNPPFYLK